MDKLFQSDVLEILTIPALALLNATWRYLQFEAFSDQSEKKNEFSKESPFCARERWRDLGIKYKNSN